MDEDDPLEVLEVPRQLGAPVYRWRAAGLMLTDEDLFAVLLVSMVVWFTISTLGLGTWGYGVFTLDPFGFFAAGPMFAYGVTAFHLAFPDDTLLACLRTGGGATSFSAWLPRGDNRWKPSPQRRMQ